MFKGVNTKRSSSKKIEKEFKDLRKNLLDLTLRNQLLNFKDRAQTLSISNQSPKNMYNLLVLQNKSMKFIIFVNSDYLSFNNIFYSFKCFV